MARKLVQVTDGIKNKLVNHDIPGLRWLIDGFNLVDKSRVREVGPDRAAAEWIVKCDGKVRFDKLKGEFFDYNELIRVTAELDPRKPEHQVHLISIDATDSSVSGFGCMHFEGLKHIKSVDFVRCKSLQDFGLEYMGNYVGNQLSHLRIESCQRITEYGLEHLKKFTALQLLVLRDLKRVHKPEQVVGELKRTLPSCEIQSFL